jgi:hypothetical protein
MPEDARRTLARDILTLIQEKQTEDPDVTEFETPLVTPIGPLETYLLRHQRKEVLAKIALNRVIEADFDDKKEPPVLHIVLGDTISDEEE